MPNWAENHLIISGDHDSLLELQEQMARPYEATFVDRVNKCLKQETQKGVFMLWNAIRPTDERAYWQLDKLEVEVLELMLSDKSDEELSAERRAEIVKELAERTEAWNADPDKAIADAWERMAHDVATKNDWYNWNIRNWGTKWDITEQAWLVSQYPRELTYQFMTAWSAPDKAITALAKQYPMLTFTLTSADFSMDWAFEMGWEDGEVVYETDLPLTHELAMRLNGECWTCDPSNDRNPELEAEWGCHADLTVPDTAEGVA
jgi:hypothetical protein